MDNELKFHEYNDNLFCQKLQDRMFDLGLCVKGKANETAALVNLHNLLYPTQQLQHNPQDSDKKIQRNNTIKAYRKWVKGQSIPEFTTLLKLCNALKVDIDYFFTNTKAPTRDIGFISDTLKLSPKAIENLLKYDSNHLRLLDNLICTPNPEYPEYTGSLQALLQTLFDFGLHIGTSEMRLIDGLSIDIVKDNRVILELLKRIPQKALDNCLLIASQSTSKDRNDILNKQLKELETKLSKKEGD